MKKPQAVGIKHGLTVLLNSSIGDYFYNDRSTIGFVVQIFQSLYFPDSTTGGISEILVSPHEDIYLRMTVNSLKSEDTIRSYPARKRGCYFEDENFDIYKDHYSYSECLTKCKMRSIEALCNCIPFYTPENLIDNNKTIIYCSLAHIGCLERYRGKFVSRLNIKLFFFKKTYNIYKF